LTSISLDDRLNPGRIKLARMRRGWNQAKLASRLGLTDRTVRAYETMGAPPNALSELADALGLPEGYFTLPSEPTVETESIRFRAGRATTRRQRDAAVADWIYRTTCTALSQRGFRGGEPDGMVSYERSRVFPQILASSKLGVVTEKRIALELRIPVEDVRAAMLDAELHAVPDGPGQRLVDRVRQSASDCTGRRPVRSGARAEGLRPV
jgi:transcriptional regulator, HTH_3 family